VLKNRLWQLRASERERRGRFFDEAGRYTDYVSVDVDGATFVVSTADASPGRRLFGSRSRAEFKLLRRACDRIEPRGVFVDLGANIGTTTIPALRYFERVLAVEAEPRNATLLRTNVALNGVEDRVTVREIACSSGRGEVAFRLSAAKHGHHAVKSAKPGSQMLSVPSVSLDELLAEEGLSAGDVGLVWLDLEGHEPHALRGATSILDASIPLVVEIRRRNVAAVEELLTGHYAHLVDLRAESEFPVAELSGQLERLVAGGGRKFTDVLALR
jgi:FkbM family methyltransferase